MKNKIFNEKRLVSFRQWSRQPFAVFNSLKLVIKISVLSAVYTLVNPLQDCNAQVDSSGITKKVELEEVEVTGQRASVVASQAARIVTVITRSEIEQAPVQSVNELLENVPQVDIRQRGVNGVQADISIQGGSFDQTLILLNGINLTDPQTGHHNLNLPLDLTSIDRIEILKGPASRVFGPNAFAGAVNFITGENLKNQIKAAFTAGDFGLYNGNISINHHAGKVTNYVNFSKSICNGYSQNTGYNIVNAFYHGNTQIKSSKMHLLLGYTEKQFGANDFYSAKYPDQKESTNTLFSGLKFETGKIIKLTPVAYWRRNFDHFKIMIGNSDRHNYHYTDVFGAGFNAVKQNSFGNTAIGFDYRNEIIYSTNLGIALAQNDYVAVRGKDSLFYTYKDSRKNYSLFLEQNFRKDKFAASVGLLVNKNSKLNGVEFYPGIDLSYAVASCVKLYSSFNRSLRIPSFTDLYYQGPLNTGNPNLKPETAVTMEMGVKSGFAGISTSVSWYHRWGKDIIDWIKLSSETKYHTENLTNLNTDGIETSLSFNSSFFNPYLKIIKGIDISYSYTKVNKSSGEFDSYYVLDNLKDKFSFRLTHSIIKNVNASWNISYQDRNGTYEKLDNVALPAVTTSYPGFWLFDSKVNYSIKRINLFMECTNIFNQQYIDIGNIYQSGSWMKAGIQVTI